MRHGSLSTSTMYVPPPPSTRESRCLKSAQILDTLVPASSASWECLRVLRWICGSRGILPESYTLPDTHLITSSHPVASGAVADIYEGTLNGRKVCVKRIRVYSKGDQRGVQKVRHQFLSFPPPFSRGLEVLPGGCHVEAREAPERCSFSGCYYCFLPAHFGLDVEWEYNRVY